MSNLKMAVKFIREVNILYGFPFHILYGFKKCLKTQIWELFNLHIEFGKIFVIKLIY